MEITETKQDFIIGEYTARTYFGEYGIHTDWFKGEEFIQSDLVPDDIQDEHDVKINEVI
jgi:hypothetical protein